MYFRRLSAGCDVATEQLGQAAQRRQRVANLVGDAGGQRPERRELIGLMKTRAQAAHLIQVLERDRDANDVLRLPEPSVRCCRYDAVIPMRTGRPSAARISTSSSDTGLRPAMAVSTAVSEARLPEAGGNTSLKRRPTRSSSRYPSVASAAGLDPITRPSASERDDRAGHALEVVALNRRDRVVDGAAQRVELRG